MRTQQLQIVYMVSPAPRARDNMVNIERPKRKLCIAPVAPSLLLPEQHMPILPVRYRRIHIRPPRNICPRRNQTVVEQVPHRSPQPHIHKLDSLRRKVNPNPLAPRFSAATQAVAHPQNGSSTISPSFDDALIMRSNNASGFCVG